MTRVLITGGAGFIGFHLARALADDDVDVDILDDFSRAVDDPDLAGLLARPGVRLLRCNLLDPAALPVLDTGYRQIYHLAAIIGVAHVLNRPFQVLHDNVQMLGHVLALARRQRDLDRLLFTSTSEVYAGSLQHLDLPVPTPETAVIALPDLTHPRSSYMLSKLYGEAMCLQSGIPTTIVRPHNVYGPRMGTVHVIPELMQRVNALGDGGDLPVASVDHTRSFCHIADAVSMLRAAVACPDTVGAVLNVGNQEQEIRIGDLAALLVEVMGRSLAITPVSATPGSPARRCPDMTRTLALTGVVPKVDLRHGLEDTYRWYRSRIFEGGEPTAR